LTEEQVAQIVEQAETKAEEAEQAAAEERRRQRELERVEQAGWDVGTEEVQTEEARPEEVQTAEAGNDSEPLSSTDAEDEGLTEPVSAAKNETHVTVAEDGPGTGEERTPEHSAGESG
jgi:N utilization substance protein A